MKFLGLMLLFFSFSILGAETDQFLAMGVKLPDGLSRLNQHVNSEIEATLSKVNKKPEKYPGCSQVGQAIFQDFRGEVTFSKLSLWVMHEDSIAKFPDQKETKGISYTLRSIHKLDWYKMLWVPLARTVNMGGIYFGTDKIGHMVYMGPFYYEQYLQRLSEGKSKTEALKAVVMYGLFNEQHRLGMNLSGVLSFADMEANFQGLMMLIDFCDGPESLLEKKDNVWVLREKVDMKNYIKPEWDESYFPNFYSENKWAEVWPQMIHYCNPKYEADARERFMAYTGFKKSFNTELIEALVEEDPVLQTRDQQRLSFLCQSKEVP